MAVVDAMVVVAVDSGAVADAATGLGMVADGADTAVAVGCNSGWHRMDHFH